MEVRGENKERDGFCLKLVFDRHQAMHLEEYCDAAGEHSFNIILDLKC